MNTSLPLSSTNNSISGIIQKYSLALLLIFSVNFSAFTQEDKSPLSVGGSVDAYYAYDFNNPSDVLHNRNPYVFSHSRHNELTVNLALIYLNYETADIRGSLGLMSGTYAITNLAHEQGIMQNIFHASAGVRLAKGLWLDLGVMPSHLGFESAISKDNPVLTRSLCAENSPYYLSGATLSFQPNDKWSFLLSVNNGWQNIAENNDAKGFGTQITFQPIENLLLNSSTFFGNEGVDGSLEFRAFHDFYAIWDINEKWQLTGQFDIGWQEDYGTDDVSQWQGITGILQYKPNEKWATAFRFENYQDENGKNLGTPNGLPLNITALSLNIDRTINKNAVWRIEFKNMSATEDIIPEEDNGVTNNGFGITTSIAISF